MSEFDVMGSISIGQYLPVDSAFHRLDARAKLLVFSFVLGAVIFAPKWQGILLGAFVAFLGVVFSEVPVKFAVRGLKRPLPFLIFLAILQLFLYSRSSDVGILFSRGWFVITTEGVMAAITMLLRFTVLIVGLGLASMTISTSQLINGLDALLKPLRIIGIPTHDFVMTIQIALRFLPFMGQAVERIAKAQASRGAIWSGEHGGVFHRVKRIVPLIVPLFVTSLKRAENLALAMDARGYGDEDQRTSMFEMKFVVVDWLCVLFSFLFSFCILFLF
jgi:energy-coupling factor transport system permease protein